MGRALTGTMFRGPSSGAWRCRRHRPCGFLRRGRASAGGASPACRPGRGDGPERAGRTAFRLRRLRDGLLRMYRLLRSRAGRGFAPPSSQGLLASHRFCARYFRARSGPPRSAQTPSIPRLSNDIAAACLAGHPRDEASCQVRIFQCARCFVLRFARQLLLSFPGADRCWPMRVTTTARHLRRRPRISRRARKPPRNSMSWWRSPVAATSSSISTALQPTNRWTAPALKSRPRRARSPRAPWRTSHTGSALPGPANRGPMT